MLVRHNPVAGAIDCMLKDCTAFIRFLDEGRIYLTNNAAERVLRGAPGRKAGCSLAPAAAASAPSSFTR